mgnify:CR=1 FL=1
MARITISLDDKLATTVRDFADASGVSQSALLRSLLHEVQPSFDTALAMYRQAKVAGDQGKQVLRASSKKMEEILPQQQNFLRSWNELMAATQQQIDDLDGGHE